MYWMHAYPTGEKIDEHLPIGYWDEIKIDGDDITAVPVFDDSDPFAMKIYKKVEHGTLRATSAGALPKPGGLSADPLDMVEGQTLPTFKLWWLKEVSICDRGSNAGAVALKYKGKMVVLSDDATEIINSFITNQKTDMKLTTLTAGTLTAMLSALKLDADTATETEVTAAVDKLVTLSVTQAETITKLTSEKNEAEVKLSEAAKIEHKTKSEALVDKAVLDRKITKDEVAGYVTLANKDDEGFNTVKGILDAKVGSATAETILKDAKGEDTELGKLAKLSYKELDKAGKLFKLKSLDLPTFKAKFKEQFGKEYAG